MGVLYIKTKILLIQISFPSYDSRDLSISIGAPFSSASTRAATFIINFSKVDNGIKVDDCWIAQLFKILIHLCKTGAWIWAILREWTHII